MTQPASETPVKPKLGSSYLFDKARLNQAGVVVSTLPDTFTVASTSATISGMNGLTMLVRMGDTLYLRYESNGDLAMMAKVDSNRDGVAEALRVKMYPLGARRSMENGRDTLYDSRQGSYSALVDSTLYLGEQTITTPAGTYKVTKVADVTDVRDSVDGTMRARGRNVTTYYFAPDIGFFARIVNSLEYFDSSNTFLSEKITQQRELRAYRKAE